jgi:putative membrane protein
MTDGPDPDAPPPRRPGPVVIEMDDADAIGPEAAPPVPEPDAPPGSEAAMARAIVAAGAPRARGSGWRFLGWAAGATLGFVLTVGAAQFVATLLAVHPLLGWVATGLFAVLAVAALVVAAREWAAVLRLGRVDALRDRAAAAAAGGDLAAARAVVDDLRRLYAGRDDMRWGMARLDSGAAEMLDADAVIALAEDALMAAPDAAARRTVEAAARTVAAATALIPLALADVAVALAANLRMIRRIAEVYGGRSGTLGSIRLLRRVFGHLLATGALAMTDDLISSVAGGGLLSKLSRRFGEGVVNGALTARVGIAAIEVCRPLPFAALPRPRVHSLLGRALTGLFEGRAGAAPDDPPAAGR